MASPFQTPSRAASSAGDGDASAMGALRLSAQFVSTYSGAQRVMIEEINNELGGDLELMALVKSCIAECKASKIAAAAQQQSLAKAVQASVDARKRKVATLVPEEVTEEIGMFVDWDPAVLTLPGADEYRLQIERGEHTHIKLFTYNDIETQAPLAYLVTDPLQQRVCFLSCTKIRLTSGAWVWDEPHRQYKSAWQGDGDDPACIFSPSTGQLEHVKFSFGFPWSVALGYPERHLHVNEVRERPHEFIGKQDHRDGRVKALIHEIDRRSQGHEWALCMLNFLCAPPINQSPGFRQRQVD